MRSRTLTLAFLAGLVLPLTLPGDGHAQVLDRLKKAAKEAAATEAEDQVERLVRNAIRCAVDDPTCVEKARESGSDYVLVDHEGMVIVDDDGAPITDPERAGRAGPTPPAPGDGAWANYDFVPGDDILVYDDFSGDRVGDFPRRFELIQGTWEVVEWQGDRYVRATSNGLVGIPLPRSLPERFTVESSVHIGHGNGTLAVVPARAYYGPARTRAGSAVTIGYTRAGIRPIGDEGPTAMAQLEAGKRPSDAVLPVRIMADGDHMKVYLGERRVTNVPNAIFPRSDTLFLVAQWATEADPILVGAVRIAGGGADLYGRLERDGRVATQGILFATNSDRIRPESTPTLEEIGRMLRDHPGLRIRIEGHTDSEGGEDHNQELSVRRADSVKQFLVERYGVDDSRLESAGFGASRPVSDNASAEGRQQNRRVELVRLDGESAP
jgi:OmpA-OmpF porin, OOP family